MIKNITHHPILSHRGYFFLRKNRWPAGPKGHRGYFFRGPEGAVRKAGGPKGHAGMHDACLPAHHAGRAARRAPAARRRLGGP